MKHQGVKCVRISNIMCFVEYHLNNAAKTCDLKIYSKIRPGFLSKTLTNIDVKTFDIDKSLDMLKFSILSSWDDSNRDL